jgi:serine/threonine protein kinase
MENYKILQQIGTGTYSNVYLAEDLRSKQTVALKVMKFFYSQAQKLQDN